MFFYLISMKVLSEIYNVITRKESIRKIVFINMSQYPVIIVDEYNVNNKGQITLDGESFQTTIRQNKDFHSHGDVFVIIFIDCLVLMQTMVVDTKQAMFRNN